MSARKSGFSLPRDTTSVLLKIMLSKLLNWKNFKWSMLSIYSKLSPQDQLKRQKYKNFYELSLRSYCIRIPLRRSKETLRIIICSKYWRAILMLLVSLRPYYRISDSKNYMSYSTLRRLWTGLKIKGWKIHLWVLWKLAWTFPLTCFQKLTLKPSKYSG